MIPRPLLYGMAAMGAVLGFWNSLDLFAIAPELKTIRARQERMIVAMADLTKRASELEQGMQELFALVGHVVVDVRVYQPEERQTKKGDPWTTASGARLKPWHHCAVSRDLLDRAPMGALVFIQGLPSMAKHEGWLVADLMHKDQRNKIDLALPLSEAPFAYDGIGARIVRPGG